MKVDDIESRDRKVETSLPVQSRVDIRVLAEMTLYWESQGIYVDSMSQLLYWSIDLCKQIIESNGQLPRVIDTALEANEFLMDRKLYQPGMKKRGKNKLNRSRQLENLRYERVDPRSGGAEGRREYDLAHNSHTVSAPPSNMVRGDRGSLSQEKLDEMTKIYNEQLENEAREQVKEAESNIEYDDDGVVIRDVDKEGYIWKPMEKEETGIEPGEAIKILKVLDKGEGDEGNEARKLSEEELREKERVREEKDREQEAALKNMNEGVEHKFV